MKHYVKQGFRTPSTEGQMLDQMYGWHMSDTQELIYDDVEKTLTLWDDSDGNIVWISDNYDINADMHSYLQHL